jgi:hypothetical protein
VAVTLEGEPVVDLWAGDADESGRPWERDTIVNVWSTTKTMAATCLLVLADRGEVELPDSGEIVPPKFPRGDAASDEARQSRRSTAAVARREPPAYGQVLLAIDTISEGFIEIRDRQNR